MHLAGRERRVLDDHAAEALLAQADRRLRDAHVGLAADDDGGVCVRWSRTAARISGVPARPNVGLSSTGVPAGSRSARRGSVEPFRSGSSSVTTIGIPSAAASATSHTARSSAEPAAAVVVGREPVAREEARLCIDDDEHGVVTLEQSHAPMMAQDSRCRS